MRKKIKIIIFSLVFSLFYINTIFASTVNLKTEKINLTKDQEFMVEALINTEGRSVNTVDGRIQYSSSNLDVLDVMYGASAVNFWVKEPNYSEPGYIYFSGLTPGGLKGSDILLFSVVFKTKSDGEAFVKTDNVNIFLNDGDGTNIKLVNTNIDLKISKEGGSIKLDKAIDQDPPESFTPMLGAHSEMFEGKYFLTFFTQDKISGVSHYYVKEGVWGVFKEAKSPYVLKDQNLDKRIFIKAFDKAGNSRVVIFDPNVRKLNSIEVTLMCLTIIMSVIAIFKVFKKNKIKT